MRAVSLILAVIFVLALIGCTTEERGALTGAGIGGAAGAIIGHQSKHTAEGALIGATVGGVAGYLIGKEQKRKTAEGTVETYVEKQVQCPHCNTILQLPANAAPGNTIKCSSCQKTFSLK